MPDGNALLTRHLLPGVPYRVARQRPITDGLVGLWLFNGGRDPAIDLCGHNRLTRVGSPVPSNYLGAPCMVFNTTTAGFENYAMRYPGIANADRGMYVRAAMLPGQTPTNSSGIASLWHNNGSGAPFVKMSMIRSTGSTGEVGYAVDLTGYSNTNRSGALQPYAMRSLVLTRQASPAQRRDFARGFYLGANSSGSGGETAPTTYQFSIGSVVGASRNVQTAISIVGLWNRVLSAAEATLLDDEPYILVEPEIDPFFTPNWHSSGAPASAPQIAVTGNGNAITDGQTATSLTDHTDFGSITEGGTPTARTYVFSNPGTATLNISGTSVPSGFTVLTALPSTIATGGATHPLVIEMPNTPAGTYSGNVSVTHDAPGSPFEFAITATVNPPAPPPPPPGPATGGGGTIFGSLNGLQLNPRNKLLRRK